MCLLIAVSMLRVLYHGSEKSSVFTSKLHFEMLAVLLAQFLYGVRCCASKKEGSISPSERSCAAGTASAERNCSNLSTMQLLDYSSTRNVLF